MNIRFFMQTPPDGDAPVEYIEFTGHNGKDVVHRRARANDRERWEEEYAVFNGATANTAVLQEPAPEAPVKPNSSYEKTKASIFKRKG